MHEWEKPSALGSSGAIFANTFTQIETRLEVLGRQRSTIRGRVPRHRAPVENLTPMVSIADKLFGDVYLLSAFGAGRQQLTFVTASALLGGNVRVGLEDNLFIDRGELASSNAQQVAEAVRILDELGHEIATPDEARALLRLKGRDEVRV